MARNRILALVAAAVLALGMAVSCGGSGDGPAEAAREPLKIGLLMSFSGGSADRSAWRERGFDLAIEHVNDAGGVFGLDVESARGDTAPDSETAVAEARRLVETEGVHAIVGPSSSANSLPVAERVTGPAGVVNISPSATSPLLTNANDSDFFFRAALADTAQGPVLARVTRERGFDNVGVIYQDDAYGRGLAESFEAAWTGQISLAAVQRGQDSYLSALAQTAAGGAQALVIIASGTDAETIVRESLESGLYDSFTFGDAAKNPNLVRSIGGDRLGGMYGTAGTSAPGSESAAEWERAFLDEHGELPAFAYVKETYDAVIAIALAAEAAGVAERSGDPRPAALGGLGPRRASAGRPGRRRGGPAHRPGRRRGRLRGRRGDAGLGRQRRPRARPRGRLALHRGRAHRGRGGGAVRLRGGAVTRGQRLPV